VLDVLLIVEVVVAGVLLGGLYACMALGFSVVWGVTNLINLAHGAMIVLGAYVTWLLVEVTGADPFLFVPASAAVLFVFGYALQALLLNRVAQASLFMTLILTFGLNLLLTNIHLELFSADPRSITPAYAAAVLQLGEVRLPYTRIAVFAAALLLTLALHLVMNHTRTGHAIRATAQSTRAAAVMGVDTGRTYALTFAIGAAMAGASGSLFAIVQSFSPLSGDSLTMKAFVIVALGGLGSIPGAISAGMLLGVGENLISGLGAPAYRDALSFLVLVALLVARPRGLFGNRYRADPRI
jgi:branched-chain amino acid transport system permease protein